MANTFQNIEIMSDSSEVVPYKIPGIPLLADSGFLSNYTGMRALCHWHNDVEFIYVLNGHMQYFVEGEILRLDQGDVLFINSKKMHYAFSDEKKDCEYACVLFQPEIIYSNYVFGKDYILPVTSDNSFIMMHLKEGMEHYSKISDLLLEILKTCKKADPGYLIGTVGYCCHLWNEVYCYHLSFIENSGRQDERLFLQRKMVSFIAKNYASPLSLDEIAASASISRSSACRIFQEYLHQSPIDFLITYRLRTARIMLQKSDKKISEIASLCGFNSQSYFTKHFTAMFGITPKELRKNITL